MSATPDALGTSILAFDCGTRVIGIAIGNRLTSSARALATMANGDWPRLDRLIAEWRPGQFVVGLPLALDGGEQSMSYAAREFARTLQERYARPVHLVDERYSSREAAGVFSARRAGGHARRKAATMLDALAAEIILQTWFAETGACSP